MTTPTLMTGYAFQLVHDEPVPMLTCSDELWDTVMLSEEDVGGARYVGQRRIDGSRCAVWIVNEGDDEQAIYAQTGVGQ